MGIARGREAKPKKVLQEEHKGLAHKNTKLGMGVCREMVPTVIPPLNPFSTSTIMISTQCRREQLLKKDQEHFHCNKLCLPGTLP